MEGKEKKPRNTVAFVITREVIQYMVLVYLIISVGEKITCPASHTKIDCSQIEQQNFAI